MAGFKLLPERGAGGQLQEVLLSLLPVTVRRAAPEPIAEGQGRPRHTAVTATHYSVGLVRGDADGVGLVRGDADGVGLVRGDADGVGLVGGDADGVGLVRGDADGVGLVRVRRRWCGPG